MKRKLHVSLSTSDLPCLRADGCPWDELVCAEAAKGGHLEVLKWPRAEGCPCEELASGEAVRGRSGRNNALSPDDPGDPGEVQGLGQKALPPT